MPHNRNHANQYTVYSTLENGLVDGVTPPIDYSEQWPNVRYWLRERCQNVCTKKFIKTRLPIVGWLPKYEAKYLFQDIVAGVTVALTAIPQGIAYAVVAGLEPQYGLYSGFMGGFVYFLLGSCKDITIGPTAIMALMIQKHVQESPDFAVLSSFLSGVIIFVLGILNLGFLIQFISIPVTVGFTSAAALTIGSSQVKSLLGMPGKSNEFIESWIKIFEHLDKIKWTDTLLGVFTILFLLVFRKLKDLQGKRLTVWTKYLSVSRNAVAVIFGAILAYSLTAANGVSPFALTGRVVEGLPTLQLPPFQTVVRNQTMYFTDMVSHLGSTVFSIPVVAVLESIAIAKSFSKGKTIDATQELIALGACNLFGSFFSSMPTTGSFTRTAINNASGVRTTLGGIVTGVIVLFSLAFLTSTFQYIPKATLAGVIITAMIFMVDIKEIVDIWRARRLDFIPFLVTLIACLLVGLEFGIVIGIAVNVLFILYNTARPKTDTLSVKVQGQNVLVIVPGQSLVFSAAEFLKYKILKYVLTDENNSRYVVINGEFIHSIDVTVAKNLKTVVNDIHLQNKYALFWNWKYQPTGLVWRLDKDFGKLFHQSDTIEEMILAHKQQQNNDVL